MFSSLPSAPRQTGLRLLPLFLLLAILTTTFASPVALQERDDTNDPGEAKWGPFSYNLSTEGWHPIVIAALAILIGQYFCLFGYRYFRITVFVVGSLFFGNIAYIVLVNTNVTDHTILLIASIIIGIACAALLAFCYQVGVYLLGALLGYTLALWLLSFKPDGLIPSHTGQYLLILALAISGALLAFFFERFILILATSFVGAFLFIFGVDIFVNTGFASIVIGLVNGIPLNLENEPWQVYTMIAAVIIKFFIAVLIQYYISWRKIGTGYRAGVPAYGNTCCGSRKAPAVIPAPVVAPAPAVPARRTWWSWRKRV